MNGKLHDPNALPREKIPTPTEQIAWWAKSGCGEGTFRPPPTKIKQPSSIRTSHHYIH